MKRSFFLLLLLLGASSCDRPSARGTSSASTDTVRRQASPTISEACGAFASIFAASATAHDMPTASVGAPRDTVMGFGGMDDEPVEPACRVAWKDSVSRQVPLRDVLARARAAGWTERDKLLMADGPDGSVLAVSRGDVACVVSGSWDGDDDSDSTYVPAPGFEIAVSCFVNRPDRY